MATIVQPVLRARTTVRQKHIPALDGIRGIAILLVFAYHYGAGGIHSASRIVRAFGIICGFGWSGVDLFFVLSGFLITGILYDTRADPGYYTKFYARRALRIFPVYYLFLFILFVIGHHWQLGHLSFLLYLGYPAAFIWPSLVQIPLRVTHLWSLSLEEQFYLVWPSLIARLRKPLKVCIAAIIAAPLLRLTIIAFGWNRDWAYGFLPCRMDALAVGAAIALLMRKDMKSQLQKWAPSVLASGSIGLATIFFFRHKADHYDSVVTVVGFSLAAFAYGALLIVSLECPRIFSLSILRMFGRYCYGLYLFHLPLTVLLEPMKPRLSIFYVPFCLLVNLAVAATSYHFFEKPIMELKKRFQYSTQNANTPGRTID